MVFFAVMQRDIASGARKAFYFTPSFENSLAVDKRPPVPPCKSELAQGAGVQ
jgi:hypothetical protein